MSYFVGFIVFLVGYFVGGWFKSQEWIKHCIENTIMKSGKEEYKITKFVSKKKGKR